MKKTVDEQRKGLKKHDQNNILLEKNSIRNTLNPFSASMLEYLVFRMLRVQRPHELNLQHNDSVTPWNAQDTTLQM